MKLIKKEHLFSTKDSIKEAYNYGQKIIENLSEDDQIYVTTAMMILHNTWVDKYNLLVNEVNNTKKKKAQ